MDSYFSLQFSNTSLSVYCDAQIVPDLASSGPFKLALCPFDRPRCFARTRPLPCTPGCYWLTTVQRGGSVLWTAAASQNFPVLVSLPSSLPPSPEAGCSRTLEQSAQNGAQGSWLFSQRPTNPPLLLSNSPSVLGEVVAMTSVDVPPASSPPAATWIFQGFDFSSASHLS